jgi:hypothetical protein
MKIRTNRWNYREYIKERANEGNSLKFEHPQSRREMQSHQDEMEEALLDTSDDTCYTGQEIEEEDNLVD